MKRLLFISHEGSITGAPVFLAKLLRYLKTERPDYRIRVLFTKGGGELIKLLSQEGFDVVVSEKRARSGSNLKMVWWRLLHYCFYARMLVLYRPDMVYSNTIVNFGEVILARLAGSPVLLHMHEGLAFSASCRYRLRLSCFFSRRVIVGSRYVNAVLRCLAGRVGVVVYNGIDLPVDSKRRLKCGDSPFRIGVLGMIMQNKGQLVALEALRLLTQRGLKAELHIAGKVGDQAYYSQLLDYIASSSLETFVGFVGFVADADVFLATMDLLVVPSFDEAFPTVILEAMAKGTPVVASDVGGISEIIDDGITGFLFPAGDSQLLANTLERIIGDEALRGALPTKALALLSERFDVRTTNRLLAMHVDEILASNG